LLIRHKTRPGLRDEVRRIWERHLQAEIDSNPGHEAYFYCFDDSDPDGICAFQVYASAEAPQAFLRTPNYAAYLEEVDPLLAGPPEVTPLSPSWIKGT
jgi:quinol monooxygenase YgiN